MKQYEWSMMQYNSGRTISLGGQEFVNFSTTSYLGLATLPEFQQFVYEGMQKYGVSYGMSPLSNPQVEIYEELELALARTYGAESALLFSTGFAASQTVVQQMRANLFELHYGSIRHPSLSIEIGFTNTKTAWVSDLVQAMNGHFFDETEREQEAEEKILDASHGFGLFDEEIKQFVSDGYIVCGSLNKALCSQAGVILCSKQWRKEFMLHPMYATSSPASPAICYALLQSLTHNLIETRREKLLQNLKLIPKHDAYTYTGKFPVLLFHNSTSELFQYLYNHGLFIWHNQYPKSSGQLVNRAVIHASLEPSDIKQLVDLLDKF